MSKKYTGRHLARLHRRRRRRAYAPTRPRAIPLAMITMRKSTHGFPLVSCLDMGLRLAAEAPLKHKLESEIVFNGGAIRSGFFFFSREFNGLNVT